ncbi:hypothetical protein FSH05_022870, partial [Escherichia coli]|nr:hypothetical protein [Escherichia coli]
MADKYTEAAVVGGVDTHKDLHVAAVVDENNKVLGTRYFCKRKLTAVCSHQTRIGNL